MRFPRIWTHFSVEVIAKLSPGLFPIHPHKPRLMDNDTYDNSRPPRRNNGGSKRFGGSRKPFDSNGGGRRFDGPRKHFDRPRKRFDDNGDGSESDGERKPRRFARFDDNGEGEGSFKPRRFSGEHKSFDRPRKSFDRPRKRFDDNGEDGEGDFKPRKSFDRPRKRFDDNGEGGEGGFRPRKSFDRPRKRFDDNGEGGEGGFKPRKSFDRPRKRFDDNGEGGEGGFKSRRFSEDRPRRRFDDNGEEGGFKSRRFSEDRPRRRFDDNGEEGAFKSRRFSEDRPRRRFDDNGEGGFKPRRFSEDRPRKTLDSNVVGRRFDIDESEESEGGFKPRRFAGERKSFGGNNRFSGERSRFDREGDGGFKSRRFFKDDESRGVDDSEKPALVAADDAESDVAESFATPPATEADEKPAKEERPAPKPLPFPKHRKVAVFGGSFDPIHNGHLMMAEYILARGLADEILFIPSAIPPHKAGMTVATPEQRLEMVRLATAYNERFSYSDMELRREGKSYSFDTMTLLQKLYPDYKLSFVIGMDSLAQLHSWYRATELVQKVDFIIYPRPNVQPPAYIDLCASFGNRNALRLLNAVLPYHDSVVTYEPSDVEGEPDKRVVTEYDLPSSQLSSTEIRQALADGNTQLLQEALPEAVLNYITENNLYHQ